MVVAHDLLEVVLRLDALGRQLALALVQVLGRERADIRVERLFGGVEGELPLVDDVHALSMAPRGARGIGENYAESVRNLKPPWYS